MATMASGTVGDALLGTVADNSTHATRAPRSRNEDLPNELIANIVQHLDSPQPSLHAIKLEPILEATQSELSDLKNVSRVCKRWRRVALPVLFKHAQYIVEDTDARVLDLAEHIQPFLEFVHEHSLSQEIMTFSLLIAATEKFKMITETHLDRQSEFWKTLFKIIKPMDIFIAAPPAALGEVTGCFVSLGDAAHFDIPYQYLQLKFLPGDPSGGTKELGEELQRDDSPSHDVTPDSTEDVQSDDAAFINSSSSEANSESRTRPLYSSSSTLFSIRSWTHLVINEGCFIKAYSVSEMETLQAPSILSNLIGNPDESIPSLISPSIHTFSYISIFAPLAHFSLFNLHPPRLHSLYVQFVPRNIIDSSRIEDIDEQDLWMERNRAYALVMREVVQDTSAGRLKDLREFETGDASDQEAWGMAVEYVRRANMARPVDDRWNVTREGLLVRGPEQKP